MESLKFRAMRMAARAGLLRPVLHARRARPIILMYHGISGAAPGQSRQGDPGLHLPLAHFVEHLRVLRRCRKVIGISEMLDGLRHGDDLHGTVAITFDDGYENNVQQAAPALAEHRTPASFFLATNYIGTRRWIWTDRLRQAFEMSTLTTLRWNGQMLSLQPRHARTQALQQVNAGMKKLSIAERDHQLSQIEAALAVELPPEPTGDNRFMDWAQARSLADAGFEVGAHTMNHAILSRVSRDVAESEIVGSRDAVAAGVGRCSSVFCYPNGKRSDINDDVVAICRQHFEAAITTEPGPLDAARLFMLPRQSAGGDGSELEAILFRAALAR